MLAFYLYVYLNTYTYICVKTITGFVVLVSNRTYKNKSTVQLV